MDIYIAHQGQTLGPFDLPTINSKLLVGEFTATDQCWSESQPVWQALSLLDGVQLPAPRPGQGPPPPPPYVPTAPSPPGSYPQGVQPQNPQSQSPYAPQPANGYPSTATNPSSDLDVESTLFDTSASPIALSMKDIVLGLLCTGGLWCIYVVARNLTTRYKLTNQRLTLRSGIVSQKVEEVEVYRVRDVSMEQEVVGRLLGFGDVVVHSSDASLPRMVLKNVPAPNKIKEQIRAASRQGRRFEGVRTGEYMG